MLQWEKQDIDRIVDGFVVWENGVEFIAVYDWNVWDGSPECMPLVDAESADNFVVRRDFNGKGQSVSG